MSGAPGAQSWDRLISTTLDLMHERDELRRRVDVLDAKCLELSELALTERTSEVREAYRRGWRAGYSTGRRGGPIETAPERHARGWIREALHG